MRIRIENSVASLDNYRWTSENKGLERALNALRPSASAPKNDPDADLKLAHAMAQLLEGEVLTDGESI